MVARHQNISNNSAAIIPPIKPGLFVIKSWKIAIKNTSKKENRPAIVVVVTLTVNYNLRLSY